MEKFNHFLVDYFWMNFQILNFLIEFGQKIDFLKELMLMSGFLILITNVFSWS